MLDTRDEVGSTVIDPNALRPAPQASVVGTVLGNALRRRQAEPREQLTMIAGFANQMSRC